NLKDLDRKLVGNIMKSVRINDWFTFYNTTFFNLVTVFLGVIVICQISFALFQTLILKRLS
ncbi:MAG: hypothetical protein RR588_13205, partial [Solibacillus sp.]